jgi:hypothetical protein
MATAETFTIPIEADGSSAEAAADSVDSLATSLDDAASAASVMSADIDSAGSAASSAASDIDTLSSSLEDMEGAAESAATSIEDVGEASSLADINAGEMAGAMGDLGGPLGRVGQIGFKTVDALKKVAASLGPVGAAAVAATIAVVALSAAFVVAIGALAKFAVESNKRAMERLGKATDRTKDNLAALFKDVRVDAFVDAFEDVVSIFDEGTNEAKALKLLVETVLNPLFDSAKVIGPFVKEMFRGMIFAVLQAAIVVVTLRNEILRAIPPEARAMIQELVDQIDMLKVAFWTGVVAITVITLSLAALTVVVGILAILIGLVLLTAVLIVAAPFIALAVVVAAVIAILYVLYEAITAGIDYLGELASAGYEAGAAMVDGLIEGIESGASEFVAAVVKMATDAVSAIEAALKIGSPSKVFASIGMDVAAGAEEGVDEGAPGVASSVESLFEPEAAAAGAPATRGGATGGGNVRGDTIINVTINAPSSEAQDIKRALTDWLDGYVVQLAAGEPA